MPKPFLVERALVIAVLVTLTGVILSVVSLLDLAADLIDLNGWEYWIIVAGLIVFVIGIYLLAGYLKLVSQFERYMKIDSRAEFKKELDEIEYLAWRLPSKFGKRLEAKKKDMGLR